MNKRRHFDCWDELAHIARTRHDAELSTHMMQLRTKLVQTERERDDLRARLDLGFCRFCSENRAASFDYEQDPLAARAVDGSVTLAADDMFAIAQEQERASATGCAGADLRNGGQNEEEEDDIPF
ncbi:hypothetical protein [Porphyrobacter sp. YT40]|uniref:hypothetical protein n=1 Tax=Porphyrobacter sp. YT40 TaxID=2547601 RepID=UPI001141C8A4|nr:hypothetical protein [Porphyrobacter sp. YT40]QDH35351.1 hypothetical protein E2E27_14115 [Porphyrobacter sp. YT40]